MNARSLIVILSILAPALRAQPTDPPGPEVVVNPKAAEELKGIELGSGETGAVSRDVPAIPAPSGGDAERGAGVAHEATQAERLIDRHRPSSRQSQTLLGVAIACGAVLVLVVGFARGRRRARRR